MKLVWNSVIFLLLSHFYCYADDDAYFIGYEALWIGGKYDGYFWRWDQEETIIPIPKNDTTFPMTKTPYWVEDPTPLKSKNRSCLALNRLDHDSYLIGPKPCGLHRPFICLLVSPVTLKVSKPVLQPPMIYGVHHNYSLYYAHYTWYEADTFCKENGMKLASLDMSNRKSSLFTLLAERMKRSRPVIENGWVGGKYVENRWIWLGDNKEISTIAPGNERLLKPWLNDPPWFRGSKPYKAGCLLIDRHLCNQPVFIEAKCERKRSFICQHDLRKSKQPEFLIINNTNLWVSNVRRTWYEANKRCVYCFENGATLLSFDGLIKDDRFLTKVVNTMAHWTDEIRHIWLAGHLDKTGQVWNWYKSNDVKRQHPGSIIDASAFAHLQVRTKNIRINANSLARNKANAPEYTEFACLNMDRENQRHVFMYGLNCNIRQTFICVSSNRNPCYCKGWIHKPKAKPIMLHFNDTEDNFINEYKMSYADYDDYGL